MCQVESLLIRLLACLGLSSIKQGVCHKCQLLFYDVYTGVYASARGEACQGSFLKLLHLCHGATNW